MRQGRTRLRSRSSSLRSWSRCGVRTIALVAGLGLLSGCVFFRDRGDRPNISLDEPDDALTESYLESADEYLNTGDQEAALRMFARAIEVNPRLFRAHLGMADIYRNQGDYAFAERSYRQARESNPRSYEAAYFHGLMLQLLDRISEAVRAYRAALALQPVSHEANLNIATAYLQLNQPVEALPFALTAARLQSEHGPTYANLGAIYASLGRHAEAVAAYERSIELMEPTPEIVLNLADSLRRVRRYSEMINVLQALIRMQPSAGAYERLGYAHFQLRRYDASAQSFREALELDPRYYPAMNGLAVNLLNRWLQSNRTDQDAHYEAIGLLRRSLQLDRNQDKIVRLLTMYAR